AERLRKGIGGKPFEVSSPHSPIKVSVSVGGFMISGMDDVTVEDVLKYADEELYKAKENGRDRVYFRGHGHVQMPDKPAAAPAAAGAAPAPTGETDDPVSGDTIQKIL